MLNSFVVSRYIRLLGWLAIAISVFTWWLDLSGIVNTCPFCRTERTMIGLLGLVMVLPHWRYVTVFLTIVFAALGLSTASQHLFLMIKNGHFSFNTPFVIGALCIISGQLLVLVERTWMIRRKQRQKTET